MILRHRLAVYGRLMRVDRPIGTYLVLWPDLWAPEGGQGTYDIDAAGYRNVEADRHVVAFDFGCKRNIYRKLSDRGLKVSIVPAQTSASEILAMNPDGNEDTMQVDISS